MRTDMGMSTANLVLSNIRSNEEIPSSKTDESALIFSTGICSISLKTA